MAWTLRWHPWKRHLPRGRANQTHQRSNVAVTICEDASTVCPIFRMYLGIVFAFVFHGKVRAKRTRSIRGCNRRAMLRRKFFILHCGDDEEGEGEVDEMKNGPPPSVLLL